VLNNKTRSLSSVLGTIPKLVGGTEANYEEKFPRLSIFRLIFEAGTCGK
jgi:hypothetical protein